MSFDYNNYTQNGDWVTFNDVGDGVIGTVQSIHEGADFKGNPCPELVIVDDNGDEKILTAGQVMLKAALAEKSPQVGDKIRIVYSGIGEAKPGKAPAKLFTIDVKEGTPETVRDMAANAAAAKTMSKEDLEAPW